MTIADQLTLLASTKTAIKQAIEGKGVTVGTVPFADYPTKIAAISGGGSTPAPWVRPADWLPLPTLTESDQKFVGLHAIYPYANFVALSASGNYTVDWGDGVVENFVSGAVAQHEYNYGTYDTGNSTLCSRGYKQAVVTVTPQAGQSLTFLNLHQRHSALTVQYSSGFLDIALASASLTDLRIGAQTPGSVTQTIRFADLERVNITRSSVANFSYMFNNCFSLQSVPLLNTSAGTNFSYMFNNCYSLQSVPLLNTAAGTNFSNMFSSCTSLQSVPLLNTSAGTYFSSMFVNCFSLQSVPLLNTSAGTNFSSMFSSCTSLQSVPLLNTSAGTIFNGMFYNCTSLQSVPLLNTSAGTNFSNMFYNCTSLANIDATGFKVSFSVASCKLSSAALNKLYTNLPAVTGQTITVTGNYGTASDDPTIATAKGWTVTG